MKCLHKVWSAAALFALLAGWVALLGSVNYVSTTADLDTLRATVVKVGDGCSGVVVAPGIAITADHCVPEGAKTVVLTDLSGNVDPIAPVVWRGAHRTGVDLALVRVSATLSPVVAKLDCTLRPKVGELVYSVGHPAALSWTVTTGHISAAVRRGAEIDSAIANYDDLVQIDGTITGGQSGGAIYSASGKLLGITVLGYPATRGTAPYGFAIGLGTVCAALAR